MDDLIILVIMIIIGFIIIFGFYKYNSYIDRTKKYSKLINSVIQLNKKTFFYSDIQSQYYYEKICNSKKILERFDHSIQLLAIIENELENFEDIILKIEYNQNAYFNYINKYNKLASTPTKEDSYKLRVPLIFLKNIENNLYNNLKQFPVQSTSIFIKALYTSPQGRNSYWRSQTFNFEELKLYKNEVENIIAQKQSKEYQRYLMTDSLRYDIMKRDQFTCQICGITRKEGAKFHIDHIIPVSKGGNTTEENLRTLCDRCNLGKSDKIEI